MNLTRAIIEHLDFFTDFVVGTDLFQGVIPSTNLDGIVVSQGSGSESESNMQSIPVVVSSHYDDYDTGFDNLTTVYDKLAYCNGLQLFDLYVHNVAPATIPGFITTTPQGKYIFSCTLTFFITRP